MKRGIFILFIITGMLTIYTTRGLAQASSTATSAASIVTPISIAKVTDMSFGNIAATGVAGTVILAPAGTRTKTGGVTLPATTGTVAAATFTVSGVAAYTYSITLPTGTITLSSGGNSMTAATFTSTPTPTGTIGGGGSQSLAVGATLSIGANQVAGTYTTGTAFTVTVNYN